MRGRGFQFLFHGRFAAPGDRKPGFDIPYEGLYTSRVIDGEDYEDAVARARELIREELDSTLLAGHQEALVSLDVEESQEVSIDDGTVINRRGFTFY